MRRLGPRVAASAAGRRHPVAVGERHAAASWAWRPGASVPVGSSSCLTARISSSPRGRGRATPGRPCAGVERRRTAWPPSASTSVAQRAHPLRGRRPGAARRRRRARADDRLGAVAAGDGEQVAEARRRDADRRHRRPRRPRAAPRGRPSARRPRRRPARARRRPARRPARPAARRRPRSTPPAPAARRRATRRRRPPARRAPSASACGERRRPPRASAPSSATVRAASATGCRRNATSVTTASVPSEPHSSLARS